MEAMTEERAHLEGRALLSSESSSSSNDAAGGPLDGDLPSTGRGHWRRRSGLSAPAKRTAAAAVGLLGLGLLATRLSQPGPPGGLQRLARGAEAKFAMKSSCSSMNEDCRESMCCSAPGTQCYEKNEDWAQCRADCTPGPDPADMLPQLWSCKELGKRAPGTPPKPDYHLKPAKWVATNCSGPGEDCSETRCCKERGKQCFNKAEGWSACKDHCVAGGPDPVDKDPHPWNCTALGMPTPGAPSGAGEPGEWVAEKCSPLWSNCKDTKCCKSPGHQCFNKSKDWAMCLPECTRGPLLTDADPLIWDCTPLGDRTPGIPQATRGHIAKWVEEECSKEGENCMRTMCCAEPTKQCYTRDDEHAGCYRGCVQTHNPYDPNQANWTCEKLGVRTPRKWQSPSLYCFHVMRVNSYENGIVSQELQLRGGAGIFACEQYDVFASDGEAWLGDGPLGKVRTHHFAAAAVGKSIDGTAANTQLFKNVWEAIKYVGRYKLTDWTIKVDPDAVLFPKRLRASLAKHPNNNKKGRFIINCNKKWMTPMMFGSVEAISREALDTYFEAVDSYQNECQHHVNQWGEDRWLNDCLLKLGATGIQDFAMVGDKVCTGADCSDGKAAYHWFKKPETWKACFDTALRDGEEL